MSLDKLVYKHYKNLNENDKYIWGYILNNKKKCQNMSIQELSASCNVSHTTILRFAQKLGLNGYSELKFYLKLENSEQVNQEKVDLRNLVDDTNKTMNILMEFDYSKIFNLLDNCNKIYAYGSGEVQKNGKYEENHRAEKHLQSIRRRIRTGRHQSGHLRQRIHHPAGSLRLRKNYHPADHRRLYPSRPGRCDFYGGADQRYAAPQAQRQHRVSEVCPVPPPECV